MIKSIKLAISVLLVKVPIITYKLSGVQLLITMVGFLQTLLHFIYWDALPNLEELVGSTSKWASTLVAQHLLAAADHYALERLRMLCEAKLCDGVAINTVATTLALAEQHNCLHLKAVCLKFIALPENLKGRNCEKTNSIKYLCL